MTMRSATETITVDGGLVEQLRRRIRTNDIQQVIVRQGVTPIAAFPSAGGMLSTAVQSAIGALAIALTDCTIEIEHTTPLPPGEGDVESIAIRWIGVTPAPEGIH